MLQKNNYVAKSIMGKNHNNPIHPKKLCKYIKIP